MKKCKIVSGNPLIDSNKRMVTDSYYSRYFPKRWYIDLGNGSYLHSDGSVLHSDGSDGSVYSGTFNFATNRYDGWYNTEQEAIDTAIKYGYMDAPKEKTKKMVNVMGFCYDGYYLLVDSKDGEFEYLCNDGIFRFAPVYHNGKLDDNVLKLYYYKTKEEASDFAIKHGCLKGHKVEQVIEQPVEQPVRVEIKCDNFRPKSSCWYIVLYYVLYYKTGVPKFLCNDASIRFSCERNIDLYYYPSQEAAIDMALKHDFIPESKEYTVIKVKQNQGMADYLHKNGKVYPCTARWDDNEDTNVPYPGYFSTKEKAIAARNQYVKSCLLTQPVEVEKGIILTQDEKELVLKALTTLFTIGFDLAENNTIGVKIEKPKFFSQIDKLREKINAK